MSFRLSALAEQDLLDIWSFVAADAGPSTADRLIDTILRQVELLPDQPHLAAVGRSSARTCGRSPWKAT